MPVLVMIFTGLLAVISGGVLAMSVVPFWRQWRLEKSSPVRVGDVGEGDVVLRGTVEPIGDNVLLRFIDGKPCVWRKIEVTEQAGKRSHTALREELARTFLLDDGSGDRITVQLTGAAVTNAEMADVAWRKMSAEFQAYLADRADFHWPNTPKTATEESLPLGCTITALGWAAPRRGSTDVPTEMVLHAESVGIHGRGIWRTGEGFAVLGSLAGIVVGVAGTLGCLAWGGWL